MYKLLIVDDEFIERNALKFIINKSLLLIGDIEETSNGREAISKCSTFKPDIILMDIKMPGINGVEAAKIIKKSRPDCKIIFLTAFNYFDYAQEAIKIGVEDFIVKPAANEQVIGILKKTIDTLDIELGRKVKQKETEDKLERIIHYLEDELIASLAAGEIEENHIKEYLSAMGIEYKTGFGLIAAIDYGSCPLQPASQLQKNMIKKRCIEKLRSEIQKHQVKCLINSIGSDIYALLVFKESLEQLNEWVLKLADKIHKTVYEQMSVNICIGIGLGNADPFLISRSFSQAKIANRYGAVANEPVTHFKDVEQNQQFLEYPLEKEKQLCEKIIRCDRERVLIILDEILDWAGQFFNSMEDIQRKAYELVSAINRAVPQEAGINEYTMSGYYREIMQTASIGEIRRLVKTVLKNLMDRIENTRSDRTNALIDKVCLYINQNYTREINLEQMSSMIGFSSYYLSKLFKKYKKMNFVDYITAARIDKARELLENPIINIKEISSLVGYNDPNYFTRVFKRAEGITPTEYRNKKMLSGQ